MGKITDHENEWLDRATAAAVAAARRVLTRDPVIPMSTPVGSLSDVEWGWIVSSMIFAWISVRAEQATVEGLDVEKAIRAGVSPDPWDAGAVAAILPKLADAIAIDWSESLKDWSRETMVQFLSTALGLIREALAARDRNSGGGTRTKKRSLAILD
jgi:hypothetical protein